VSRTLRRLLIVVLALTGGFLFLIVVAVISLFSARPQRKGEIAVAGLRAPVEVWRDSLGVAHVWADSEYDLFFAQGYVHAQERLWQMELFRHVAEGRLAEMLGPPLVETDRFLRSIGLWRAAGDQEAALDESMRMRIEAYVTGVNASIRTRSGTLPPEFLALGIRPEPWTLRHTLAIEKIMAWDLAQYGSTAALARSMQQLGAERVRFVEPAYPQWGPTIVTAPAPAPVPGPAAMLLAALTTTNASNSWVIGGTRTRSGKPILANDMHLALRAPSLWYLMALHGGGYDVAGMTLPGVPLVIAGHNRAVAWGFTNAELDDVDFFLIRPDSADAERYITRDGSQRFRIAAETLRVRGQPEPVTFEVRLTRHGPVLPAVQGSDTTLLVAMRWAGHDPAHTFRGIVGFNSARSAYDVVAAARLFDNPHQNVVYADSAGNFGYVMAGRIPMRGDGRRPPLLPVPGWTGEWDWNGYLPADRHPVVMNPAEGFVVTANNRQAAGAAADLITADWDMPYRAARIREMIAAQPGATADDVHRMQLDVRDGLAQRYVPRAIASMRAAGLAKWAEELEAWNFEARADSHAAAIFYIWYERLRTLTALQLYGSDGGWLSRGSFNALLDSAALPWLEERASTVLDSLMVRAALEADSITGDRDWGRLHTVSAEHALGVVSSLNRLLRLRVGPEPAAGSATTVNVASWDDGAPPFRANWGASQRHVVDLGDVDNAGGFILPTGQSGLSFESSYRDHWSRWRNGGLWRIPLDRSAAQQRIRYRLVLHPGGEPKERQ
jgi:penicillin amidase